VCSHRLRRGTSTCSSLVNLLVATVVLHKQRLYTCTSLNVRQVQCAGGGGITCALLDSSCTKEALVLTYSEVSAVELTESPVAVVVPVSLSFCLLSRATAARRIFSRLSSTFSLATALLLSFESLPLLLVDWKCATVAILLLLPLALLGVRLSSLPIHPSYSVRTRKMAQTAYCADGRHPTTIFHGFDLW